MDIKNVLFEEISAKYRVETASQLSVELFEILSGSTEPSDVLGVYSKLDYVRSAVEIAGGKNISCDCLERAFSVLFENGVVDFKLANALLKHGGFRQSRRTAGAISSNRYDTILVPRISNFPEPGRPVINTGFDRIVMLINAENSVVVSYLLNNLLASDCSVTVLFSKGVKRYPFAQRVKLRLVSELRKRFGDSREVFLGEEIAKLGFSKSSRDTCAAYGADFLAANGFDVDQLKSLLGRPDGSTMGVFVGSDMIRKPTLDYFHGNLFHMHPGWIPSFRGFDCTAWACLENRFSEVGYTIQSMAPRLDAGAIIHRTRVDPGKESDTEILRSKVQFQAYKQMSHVIADIYRNGVAVDGEANGHPGTQCFVMHPTLKRQANKGLASSPSQ